MTNMNRKLIFLTEMPDVGFSLKRALLKTETTTEIDVFHTESDDRSFVENLYKIRSCLPPTCVLLFLVDTSRLLEYIWGRVRVEAKSLFPVAVLGVEEKFQFLENPLNLVFKDRPCQYRYIEIPFELKQFSQNILELRSIYNDEVRISDIKNYGNPYGLLSQYAHHIKNTPNKLDIDRIKYYFSQIKYLLSYLEISGDKVKMIEKEIDNFIQNTNIDAVESLIRSIEDMQRFH